MKFLPEAKKINQQGTEPVEELFYELRESFSINFDFSYLANIDSIHLLYLVSAFGFIQNYETFIMLSSLKSNVNVHKYHRQAIYIAFKCANFKLINYFLKYLKI